jgi:hypothetical protein
MFVVTGTSARATVASTWRRYAVSGEEPQRVDERLHRRARLTHALVAVELPVPLPPGLARRRAPDVHEVLDAAHPERDRAVPAEHGRDGDGETACARRRDDGRHVRLAEPLHEPDMMRARVGQPLHVGERVGEAVQPHEVPTPRRDRLLECPTGPDEPRSGSDAGLDLPGEPGDRVERHVGVEVARADDAVRDHQAERAGSGRAHPLQHEASHVPEPGDQEAPAPVHHARAGRYDGPAAGPDLRDPRALHDHRPVGHARAPGDVDHRHARDRQGGRRRRLRGEPRGGGEGAQHHDRARSRARGRPPGAGHVAGR